MNSKTRLRGGAKLVDIAETVEDDELAFELQSSVPGRAARDIARKADGKVWGVLE